MHFLYEICHDSNFLLYMYTIVSLYQVRRVAGLGRTQQHSHNLWKGSYTYSAMHHPYIYKRHYEAPLPQLLALYNSGQSTNIILLHLRWIVNFVIDKEVSHSRWLTSPAKHKN